MPLGSLVLPPPLPVRPPVLLPCGAVVARPALCVVILSDIIYTRDDMCKIHISVWISQKSQENNQKRANTDARIRRVQKEAKDAKP
ncbi:hypothetical protein Tco_0136890 [Tanacetum coccineum]